MTQRILSIDSQILNSIQACARKTNYQFVRNLNPPVKAEALERGSLIHDMLEIYYSLKGNCIKENAPWIGKLTSAGLVDPMSAHPTDHASIVKLCIEAGNYFSTQINLDANICAATIKTFRDYAEYYEHDSWHALAVEEVGSKILHEDDELKIVYNFKVDLVAEKGTIIAPWDHKSGARNEEPTSLSNQFIGYCYGLNVTNIVINKIGFQKTLSAKERFPRYILSIDPVRIEEWRQNAIYWCRMLAYSLDVDQWPMNLTHCDKYSGCIYERICTTTPESRERTINIDYVVGEKWDVASMLESKKE